VTFAIAFLLGIGMGVGIGIGIGAEMMRRDTQKLLEDMGLI
jgi:hypothetical protein